MKGKLRVVIADDERPARSLLSSMLGRIPEVELVGEASGGAQAVRMIEETWPDLALLDLQMPEVDGLSVVRLLESGHVPMVAFVTAHDEYAVRAFEMNALDYLLKPVDEGRLRSTIERAIERLQTGGGSPTTGGINNVIRTWEPASNTPLLRIPVRKKDEIVLLAVQTIASIVADGELLRLTTSRGETHTITYRLKDIERRLDPANFVRLSRGALVNIEFIAKVTPMPGGLYRLTLANGQQLFSSRIHSRLIRERLLKI